MRRPPVLLTVLVSLLALTPAVHARRAVAVVQTNAFTSNTDDNSLVVSSTAGNVLVVLGHIIHATQALTISDTAGSTWNACPALRSRSGPGSPQAAIWWALSAASGTTITLTSAGGANTGGLVLEASGMGTPTCDETGTDETSAGTSHGGAISVTPSAITESLVVGVVASSSPATFSVTPGGYTAFTGAPTVNAWAGYKLVTSTSANTFASTSGGGEDTLTTVAVLMSEPPAGGGSGPCLRMLRGMGRC
jgi:hypothetical protein